MADFIRTADAAKRFGISESYLNSLRCRGGGPEFVRVSRRLVLYDVRAIEAWLNAKRCRSTSESVAA